jgi:hypothetical protein
MQRDFATYIEELRQDMIADHDRLKARLEDLLATVSDNEDECRALIDEISTRHAQGQANLVSGLLRLQGQLSAPVSLHQPPPLPHQRDERFGPYTYNGVRAHG